MAQAQPSQRALKQALKEALTETLLEQRGLLREVFAEVLEDIGLAKAIQQGRKTGTVSRDAVFRTLRDKR
jgi:hypothetical protein